MEKKCRFHQVKGFISDLHYCSLIDESISKEDIDVCYSEFEDSCEFYQFYLKKRREAIITEKVKEELG